MLRLVGRGQPLLHRFKVGLEFAVSGVRDLDGMISRHAAVARSLACEIGLPEAVQAAVGASYEQWDGRGWPGALRGDAVPVAARLAQLAEFVEVAHRVSGVGAAVALARERAGGQFDPTLCALLERHAEDVLGGLDRTRTWDAVIAAEPALAVTVSGRPAGRRAGGGGELRGPEVALHARARAGGGRAGVRRGGPPGLE